MRRQIDAFNRRDLDALLAEVTDDVELIPFNAKFLGVPYRGAEGVRHWLDDMHDEWVHSRVDIEEMRVERDAVVVIGRIVGRTKGTEVDVDVPAAFVNTVRDGKLARMESYSDAAEAMASVNGGLRAAQA